MTILINLALLLAAFGQETDLMGPSPEVQRTEGPAIVCGSTFGLRLASGENVDRQEGIDFSLFYVEGKDGPYLLYEGGHPQAHDDKISTKAHVVVAVHDSRSPAAKSKTRIRDRLILSRAFERTCREHTE